MKQLGVDLGISESYHLCEEEVIWKWWFYEDGMVATSYQSVAMEIPGFWFVMILKQVFVCFTMTINKSCLDFQAAFTDLELTMNYMSANVQRPCFLLVPPNPLWKIWRDMLFSPHTFLFVFYMHYGAKINSHTGSLEKETSNWPTELVLLTVMIHRCSAGLLMCCRYIKTV